MNLKTTKTRLLALDLLRGYFLIVIIIDHIFRFPNIFEFITGRGQLWVSAAEGFFIISGFLVGYLHQPALVIWARAVKIYLISVIFTLLFTFFGHFMRPDLIMSGIWQGGSITKLVISTISLTYTYGWTDFLPFYAVFLIFAPVGLLLIRQKRTWLVLITSLLLWFIRGDNRFLAWQILFFTGLILGSRFSQLKSVLAKLSAKLKHLLSWGLIGIFLLTLALSIFYVFIKNVNSLWFDKDTLGPGRLVLAWVWFTALFVTFSSWEITINTLTQGLLKRFGQNSLLVYCSHAVVLFPLNSLFPYGNYLESSLLSAFILGFIYFVCIGKKNLFRTPSNIASTHPE